MLGAAAPCVWGEADTLVPLGVSLRTVVLLSMVLPDEKAETRSDWSWGVGHTGLEGKGACGWGYATQWGRIVSG